MLGLRLVDTQSLMRIIQGRLGMLKGSGNEDVCLLYFVLCVRRIFFFLVVFNLASRKKSIENGMSIT